jgi:hypothetical protein
MSRISPSWSTARHRYIRFPAIRTTISSRCHRALGRVHAAEGELDPVKRAALFIAMNYMVVEDGVVIPVVCRPQVSAISKMLRATLSGWDNTFWNLKDWYREA